MIPVPIQILGHYSNDRSRNSSYNRNRNYSNNRNRSYSNNQIEVIQIKEINVTNTIDQETIRKTDLIIKETITPTIIGHETTHKIGIPIITIEEIIHNPFIETTINTLILNTNIEVTPETSATN